jgi:hypothetical protein
MALCAIMLVTSSGLPIEEHGTILSEAQGVESNVRCFERESSEAKAKCCLETLKSWREKQALWQDVKDAEMKYLTHSEESSSLRSGAESARHVYDASDTAKLYTEGIRDCVNAESEYTLPEAPDESASRMQADASYKGVRDQADNAKKTIDGALADQASNMAKLAKVDDELRNEVKSMSDSDSSVHKSQLAEAEAEQLAKTREDEARTAALATAAATERETESKTALTTAETNLETLQGTGASQLDEFKTALDGLKKTEAQKLDLKGGAEVALNQAKDAKAGAEDQTAAAQVVTEAEEALSDATTAAADATGAIESKEAEKAKFESDHAAAITAAETQISTEQSALAAARAEVQEKQKQQGEAEATSRSARESLVKIQEKSSSAAESKQDRENRLSQLEKEKANLQSGADEAAAKAKQASEDFGAMEERAANLQHTRGTAIQKEEKALTSAALKQRSENAVKWEEHFEDLKSKVGAVNGMYEKFVSCVKDSKWVC